VKAVADQLAGERHCPFAPIFESDPAMRERVTEETVRQRKEAKTKQLNAKKPDDQVPACLKMAVPPRGVKKVIAVMKMFRD